MGTGVGTCGGGGARMAVRRTARRARGWNEGSERSRGWERKRTGRLRRKGEEIQEIADAWTRMKTRAVHDAHRTGTEAVGNETEANAKRGSAHTIETKRRTSVDGVNASAKGEDATVQPMERNATMPYPGRAVETCSPKASKRTLWMAACTWFLADGWTWTNGARKQHAWAVPTTPPTNGRVRYLGLATSSSSYGGYGGNENSEDRYKYYYDVPEEWDQATVNKIEKATNGTDSKFVSKKRGGGGEKIQLITFPGYASLKPQRAEIMNDLAISDYDLQDILSGAEDIQIRERQVEGVTYVDYDIYSYKTNVLASVAADGGRLYAWFCWIPTGKWEQEEQMARELRESFGVIQRGTEAEIKANLDFYKRS